MLLSATRAACSTALSSTGTGSERALPATRTGPLRDLGGTGDWPRREVGVACAACLWVTRGVLHRSCMFEPEGNACSLTDSTAEEHVLALVEHAADEARDRVSRLLPGGKVVVPDGTVAQPSESVVCVGTLRVSSRPPRWPGRASGTGGSSSGAHARVGVRPSCSQALWTAGPSPGVRGSSGGRHRIGCVSLCHSTDADPARLLCRSLTLFSVYSRFCVPPQALTGLTRYGW